MHEARVKQNQQIRTPVYPDDHLESYCDLPLYILEDLFGPCGTKLVYKEPSLTFMVQKRNPQMDLLWTIESTKYQRL